MPAEIQTTEPTALTAGDSWQWERAFPGFPASDGWALSYALRGPGTLDIEAEAAGDAFRISVAPEDTERLAAGTYHWAARLAHTDGRRHTIATGRIEVAPDLAQLTDGRTHAERTLEVIRAAIEGRLTKDMEQVSINGRSVMHIPIAELLNLKRHYEELVAAERGDRGFFLTPVEVRFGPV